MFRTAPLSIIRSFFTVRRAVVYVIQVLLTASEQERPDSARKLSANLYDIHHCCVYSEKLLMMDGGTVRNMYSFVPKINFEKIVLLVGFIIRIYHDALPPEGQMIFLCRNRVVAVRDTHF